MLRFASGLLCRSILVRERSAGLLARGGSSWCRRVLFDADEEIGGTNAGSMQINAFDHAIRRHFASASASPTKRKEEKPRAASPRTKMSTRDKSSSPKTKTKSGEREPRKNERKQSDQRAGKKQTHEREPRKKEKKQAGGRDPSQKPQRKQADEREPLRKKQAGERSPQRQRSRSESPDKEARQRQSSRGRGDAERGRQPREQTGNSLRRKENERQAQSSPRKEQTSRSQQQQRPNKREETRHTRPNQKTQRPEPAQGRFAAQKQKQKQQPSQKFSDDQEDFSDSMSDSELDAFSDASESEDIEESTPKRLTRRDKRADERERRIIRETEDTDEYEEIDAETGLFFEGEEDVEFVFDGTNITQQQSTDSLGRTMVSKNPEQQRQEKQRREIKLAETEFLRIEDQFSRMKFEIQQIEYVEFEHYKKFFDENLMRKQQQQEEAQKELKEQELQEQEPQEQEPQEQEPQGQEQEEAQQHDPQHDREEVLRAKDYLAVSAEYQAQYSRILQDLCTLAENANYADPRHCKLLVEMTKFFISGRNNAIVDIYPSIVDFGRILRAMGHFSKLYTVKKLFLFLIQPHCREIVKKGKKDAKARLLGKLFNINGMEYDKYPLLELNPQIFGVYIDAVSQCNDHDAAIAALEALPVFNFKPNQIMFSRIIKCFAEKDDFENAFLWLQNMKKHRMLPSQQTITPLLALAAKKQLVFEAERMVCHLIDQGEKLDAITLGCLVELYGNVQNKEMLHRVVEVIDMSRLVYDRIMFATLISNFGKVKEIEQCIKYWNQMKESNIPPNKIVYHSMLMAHGLVGDWSGIEKLLQEMRTRGPKSSTSPTDSTFCIIADSLAKSDHPTLAYNVENVARAPSNLLYGSLVRAATKAGDDAKVWDLFSLMLKKNSSNDSIPKSTLNHLISYYAARSNFSAVEKVFEVFKKQKVVKPDVSTLNTIIKALYEKNELEQVLSYFDRMQALHLKPNYETYSYLLLAAMKLNKKSIVTFRLESMHRDGIHPSEEAVEYLLPRFRDNPEINRILNIAKSHVEKVKASQVKQKKSLQNEQSNMNKRLLATMQKLVNRM